MGPRPAGLSPLRLAWALLVALLVPAVAQGQSPTANINVVKAAYLYRFTGYVEWPPTAFESPASPLVIGVAGNEAVYAELARLVAGRTGLARPIRVRKLASGDELGQLHVLFAAGSGSTLGEWAQRAQDLPVLVVGDAYDGLEQGVALNFVVTGQRLRFEASRAAFDRARLKASAHLLALATRVTESR